MSPDGHHGPVGQPSQEKQAHRAFFAAHTFGRDGPHPGAEVRNVHSHHIFERSLFANPRRIRFFSPTIGAYLEYHSRAHRKNRHAKIVQENLVVAPELPTLWNNWSDLSNISWHVAVWFCLGSICWIVNGQYALMQSSSQHVIDAIGWSGFAGGTCFWIGAYLAVVESLNLNANLLYGTEVEKARGKLKQDLLLRYHQDGKEDTDVYCHVDSAGDTVCRAPWRWVGYSPTIGFWASCTY